MRTNTLKAFAGAESITPVSVTGIATPGLQPARTNRIGLGVVSQDSTLGAAKPR